MMVSSLMGVECSAKIAMSALHDGAAAMALLRDRDRPRCIFVGFRAREFVNQTLGTRTRVLGEKNGIRSMIVMRIYCDRQPA
jgi:hypothetical protein